MEPNRITQTIVVAVSLTVLAVGRLAVATDYFVAPDGLPSNEGDSIQSPWDLETALALRHSVIGAGDRIWLRRAEYRPTFEPGEETEIILAFLDGDPNNPIIVSSYPGEWAVIDGQASDGKSIIGVIGHDARYMNFELMSSHPRRVSQESGGDPTDIERGWGIITGGAAGSGIVFAGLVIHDARQGITAQQGAPGLKAYGNICYYNGWDGADGAHGHGMYPRNAQTGVWKEFKENIIFNQFGYGLHAWSDDRLVNDLAFEGNISFGNGILAPNHQAYRSNLLVHQKGVGLNLIRNFTYYIPGQRLQPPSGKGGACVRLTKPQDVTVDGNYIVSSGQACVGERLAFKIHDPNDIVDPNGVSIVNNTFIGDLELSGLPLGSGNQQYNTDPPEGDCNDLPATNRIEVRPVNDYRFNDTYKRAHIVIYNWEGSTSIELPAADLNDVLQSGDPYEIYDIQTTTMSQIMEEGPVLHALASGTWDGSSPITIDVNDVAARPVLDVVHQTDPDDGVETPPHTSPGFLVLLLIKPGDYDGDGCIDRDDCTPLGSGVPNGCSPQSDFDGDGDVDLSDFAVLAACYGGAGNPPPSFCALPCKVDIDGDGDVDLDDFGVLAQEYTGSLAGVQGTPSPPGDVPNPGDRITIGIDDTAGPSPNQGTYPPSSDAKISYEVYVSIDELGDGPNSQGLGGLAVDIVSNTGIQQPKPSFSATSSATPVYLVTDQVWIGGQTPKLAGGFGFNGSTSQGNNTAKIGSVIGAGVHMKIDWDADVAPGASGLQPRALHNVGFTAPPGTDVGGNSVPSSQERSRWYVLKGEIKVPDAPGSYTVEVKLQSLSLIRSGIDLTEDQTQGYLIGIEENGDGFVEGSFSFIVTGS